MKEPISDYPCDLLQLIEAISSYQTKALSEGKREATIPVEVLSMWIKQVEFRRYNEIDLHNVVKSMAGNLTTQASGLKDFIDDIPIPEQVKGKRNFKTVLAGRRIESFSSAEMLKIHMDCFQHEDGDHLGEMRHLKRGINSCKDRLKELKPLLLEEEVFKARNYPDNLAFIQEYHDLKALVEEAEKMVKEFDSN